MSRSVSYFERLKKLVRKALYGGTQRKRLGTALSDTEIKERETRAAAFEAALQNSTTIVIRHDVALGKRHKFMRYSDAENTYPTPGMEDLPVRRVSLRRV